MLPSRPIDVTIAQAPGAADAELVAGDERPGRRPTARIPRATYRWQFNRGFTFRDARRLVAYLHDLGVSDVYASPYLKASAESTHGYDVVDHAQLNPALGSQRDFEAFCEALQRHGLGQILDVVPNHMGIAAEANRWWMDVLEHGPSSPYADYFDITWDLIKADLRHKVLLPVLGDQYGTVLERGELALVFRDGAFLLQYFESTFPIAPETYGHLLHPCLGALSAEVAADDPRVLELQAIVSAVGRLPGPSETTPERVAERRRQSAEIRRRLATLAAGSPEVRAALEAALRIINGVPDQPTSFDRLDALLEEQSYRLAYWRVASEEINYRRFFDINQLAALRVEREEVFRATHRLILDLLAAGRVTGLRIDHPDGLWDPQAYLERLQRAFLAQAGAIADGDAPGPANGRSAPTGWATGDDLQRDALPLYVLVEKVLGSAEALRTDWPVHGTTGYDFLNEVGGLFVDPANRRAFDELYNRFAGQRINYRELTNASKKQTMLVSLASEINALAFRLDRISERQRRLRDFTRNALTFAIREVIAALGVYRTYSRCGAPVAPADQQAIEVAVAEARRRNPRTDPSIFTFIRDLLLLRFPGGEDVVARAEQCDLLMRFQQTSGPVMAKAVEDTAFYIYNRLVALNEVGGEPDRFGLPPDEVHQRFAARARDWPHTMLATSTHDTKRSEDVRARISVLSELPRELSAALGRWRRINARHRTRVDGRQAPDRNDEYLIYQTLLGAWPFEPLEGSARADFVARIQAYLEKAIHEAKVHTSWINPNEGYDAAVREFIAAILDPRRGARFLESFEPFRDLVAYYGVFNSLGQTLIKLTAPGVPDLYQGTELWDFSLVDPDNRRPVDYDLRIGHLKALRREIARGPRHLASLASELLCRYQDGRVKLYLTHRLLGLREREPELFRHGGYEPLRAEGVRANHVFSFARTLGDRRVAVVVPRFAARLAPRGQRVPPLGPEIWSDDRLDLGEVPAGRRYRELLTGRVLVPTEREGRSGLPLAEVLASFPVAVLELLHD